MKTPHRFAHRVRFRESDPMGIAYHVHYLDWFEYGRTEALRELGMPYKDLQDSGISMPVIDLAIKYHRSAFYDDQIIIETVAGLSESGMRLTCEYRVFRDHDQALLATGHVTLCFLNEERTRPVPAPDEVRKILKRIEK